MESTDVFITAGPNPRMRFKRVRCSMVTIDPGTNQVELRRAMASGESLWRFGPRCKEDIIIFFKNSAICPVHGLILTKEPWTEGDGGKP